MRLQGKVLNWNDDRGFGFVEPNGGGERAFVHIKAFKSQNRRPISGDIITYKLVRGKDNRYKATNIRFTVGDRKPRQQGKGESKSKITFKLGICFILGFCCILFASVFTGRLPLIVAKFYALISLFTFLVYAFDKSAAQGDRWRTKESTLHSLALIGGWPGAYLAQNLLRHKSSKEEFKGVYKFTVILNLGAFYWLHTEDGLKILNTFLSP